MTSWPHDIRTSWPHDLRTSWLPVFIKLWPHHFWNPWIMWPHDPMTKWPYNLIIQDIWPNDLTTSRLNDLVTSWPLNLMSRGLYNLNTSWLYMTSLTRNILTSRLNDLVTSWPQHVRPLTSCVHSFVTSSLWNCPGLKTRRVITTVNPGYRSGWVTV